jgi:8-oxo-dGTP pyrophosphatase MutT (NUDIX family)
MRSDAKPAPLTPATIRRVTELDLKLTDQPWVFAQQRRAEIDAHFAQRLEEKPKLWNGRILLGRNPVFTENRFSADYFETDFASFLAWRDWGFVDREVFNGFGMGALYCADGAYLLGEMADHTANAGRIYFPSGTPDLEDIRGLSVDIAGSVAREVEEETGLTTEDYAAADHWDCVVTGFSVAMMRVLHVASSGEALRAKIESNLASQALPELCAIHLVHHTDDITPAMTVFVTAFLKAKLNSAD